MIMAIVLSLFASESVEFGKQKLKLGSETLIVEVADTDAKRQRGLMYREKLEEGHGMLFIFGSERQLSFWMKNTFIPLSIGYFDKNRRLVDIQKMNPVESVMVERPPSYPSRQPAQYALEVPQGWFEKKAVPLGSQFVLLGPQPSAGQKSEKTSTKNR